jgi:asparagine synthetase A
MGKTINPHNFHQITGNFINKENLPDKENKINEVKNILLNLWDFNSELPGGSILTLYVLKKMVNYDHMKHIFNVFMSISNVILPSVHPRHMFIAAYLLISSHNNISNKNDDNENYENNFKIINTKNVYDNYGMRKNLSLRNVKINQNQHRICLDARVIDLFFIDGKVCIFTYKYLYII